MLRVPSDLKKCVCFICLMKNGRWKYGGTGIIVGYPVKLLSEGCHTYIATARHLIDDAKREGLDVKLRLNTKDGGVRFVGTSKDDWLSPENGGLFSDIALLPVDFQDDLEVMNFPTTAFATEETIGQYIGVGTETFALGLFTHHKGRNRNLPILRSGHIASMPDEPLYDSQRKMFYNAYLVELRSLGGLSGSPVFAFYERGTMVGRAAIDYYPMIHGTVLLGLIRGHWDVTQQRRDMSYAEGDSVNIGIATITPIQEILPVLERGDLVRQRDDLEHKILKRDDITLDSGKAKAEPFTREKFENALKER